MEKINDITNLINLDEFDIIIYRNLIVFRIRYKENTYISGFDFNNLKKKYYFFRNCMGVDHVMNKLVNLKNNKDSSYKIYEKDDNIHLKIENNDYKLNKIEIFEIILKKFVDKFNNPELLGLLFINAINHIKEGINNIDNKVKSINPWKQKIFYEKRNQQINNFFSKLSKIKKKVSNLSENLYDFTFKKNLSFQPYNENTTLISIDCFPNGNYISNDILGNIKIWNSKNELIGEIVNNITSECGGIIIKNNNCFIHITKSINEYIRNNITNTWELSITNIFLNENKKINIIKPELLILTNIILCNNKLICHFRNNLNLIQVYEKILNGSYQLINTIELPFESFESIGGIIFINESLTLIIATSKSVYLLNYITFEIKTKYNNSVRCYLQNGICKLDKYRILIHNGNKKVINILNIKTNEFNELKIANICWSIFLFKEKNFFLCGSNNGVIQAFKTNDYTLCCTVDLQINFIKGFFQLPNQKDVIGCYSELYICFIKYEKQNKNDNHELY